MVTVANNYRKLRELVSSAVGSAIPYLGMYMGDLTSIEEGNATVTEDDLYNVEKLEMVAKIVLSIEQFKAQRFALAPQPLLQHYLRSPSAEHEDGLFAMSLAREPRTNKSSISSSPGTNHL